MVLFSFRLAADYDDPTTISSLSLLNTKQESIRPSKLQSPIVHRKNSINTTSPPQSLIICPRKSLESGEREHLSLDSHMLSNSKKINLFGDCFEQSPPPPSANMTNEEKINYLEKATVSVTERIRFMERKIMDFSNKISYR